MAELSAREKRLGLHLPVQVSGQDAANSPFAEATRSVNISAGGICFESRRNLVVGSRLTLHISLPEPLRRHFGGRSVYRVRVAICRLEHLEGHDLYRASARFLAEVEA
jgi:hypothetical protein